MHQLPQPRLLAHAGHPNMIAASFGPPQANQCTKTPSSGCLWESHRFNSGGNRSSLRTRYCGVGGVVAARSDTIEMCRQVRVENQPVPGNIKGMADCSITARSCGSANTASTI